MRRRAVLFLVVMMVPFALASYVHAQPSVSQVNIYNTLYGTSLTQAGLHALLISNDQRWIETNGGAVAEAKFAGFSQYFGFYTGIGTGSGKTTLFSNITAGGYLTGMTASFDPNVQFGFFTDPSGASSPGPYYTETGIAGSDTFDHFRVYTGGVAGETIIFTEDLFGGGDQDFADLVVTVTGVEAVPEPGTLLLLGPALLAAFGLGGWRRMRRR